MSTGRKLVYSLLTVLTIAAVATSFTGGGDGGTGDAAAADQPDAVSASSSTARVSTTTPPPPIPKALVRRVFPKLLPGELSRARAAPDGKGGYYVIGGLDFLRRQVGLITQVNPAAFTSRTAGALTVATANHGAALLGGKVVVVGGGFDGSAGVKSTQSFEGAGAGKVIGDLGQGRYGFGSAVVGDRLIIVGGGDNKGDNLSVVATTDGVVFTPIATLNAGVRYPAVAALGRKVYVIGGEIGGRIVGSVTEIDVDSGAVTKINADLDVPTSHAAGFEINGAIFVAGGKTDKGPTDRVWRFDPAVPTFLIGGTLPSPRSDSAAVVVNNKAYVIGGETPAFLQEIVEFTPTTDEGELFTELSKSSGAAVPVPTQPKSNIATVPRTTVVITQPKQK